MTNPVLQCHSITKAFREKAETITILDNLELIVKPGERIGITGSSGSGKTTLLNLLAGLDQPDTGKVTVDGLTLNGLNEKKSAYLRNEKLGFVFQFHHLLPEFTALENVSMPLLIRKNISVSDIRLKAEKVLKDVGLSKRLHHKPAALSGGERQRVAIARALVTKPALVLMDEPTGNLDHHTADAIHDLVLSLSSTLSTSFIIVTHDQRLAAKMDKVYHLTEGKLNETTNKNQTNNSMT